MPHVKIYDTDSSRDIARKIFYEFDVSASCNISGFVEKNGHLVPKGEYVLEFLDMFDQIENIRFHKDKKMRKTIYRKNSVGGPIAQKIFTWEKRIVDNEVRYTIWRFQ